MSRFNHKSSEWLQKHNAHIDEYLSEIDALYEAYTRDLVQMGMQYDYSAQDGDLFSFASNKARQENASASLSTFKDRLKTIVTAGIASEWAFANEKVDSWVKELFSDPKDGYLLHNLDALDAFAKRTTYGHTLSGRVWNITRQFQQQIELSLSVGISEGRSAAKISQDVRAYLNDPDKLFRKVRNAFGEKVLSKKGMSYHPGQGVYRSSYQNALRMVRTEINSAYMEADYLRWQQLDFIVGYEVKTSKTHAKWLAKFWYPRFKKGRAPLEICDAMEGKYPKDFKFIGWHPNCRCYAVPILANEGTGADWWEAPQNEVKELPQGLQKWVEDNKNRITAAAKKGTLPYWISENKKYVSTKSNE